MNNQRISKLLLQYVVAGQDQALSANTSITLSLKEAEAAAKQAGTSLERLQELANARIAAEPLQGESLQKLKALEQAQEAAAASSKERARAEAEVTEELRKQQGYLTQRLNNPQDFIQRLTTRQRFQETGFTAGLRNAAFNPPAGGSGGGRSVTGVLSGVREGLIALPNVGYQNPAVVALRGLIPLAEKTGASFGQLGAALGIAGVAVAAVAIALAKFNEGLEGSKRLLEGALAAQRNYYDALAEMTSAEAGERINELQRVRPLLEQEAAEARGALDSAFAQLQQQFGDFDARLQINSEAFAGLRDAATKAEAALTENVHTEARLTQGRKAGVFAANDAIAAENKLATLRREQFQFAQQLESSRAGNQVNNAQLRLQADRMTAEERAARRREIESDLRILNEEQRRPGVLPEASEQLTKQITALQQEYLYLTEIQDTYADQLKREADARDAANSALRTQLDALKESAAKHQELSAAIRTASVEDVSNRLHSIQEEQAAIRSVLPELERLAATSEEGAAQLAEARSRLGVLSGDFFQFVTRVLPAALARASQEYTADVARIQDESKAKIDGINADLADKEAEAKAKRDEDYLAAEEKRNEGLADLAEDLAERREKIERKSAIAISNAVFARDALTAYLTMQQKQEDLQDLKNDGERRRKELDAQFAKERKQADDHYRKSLEQARAAAAKAIQLEQSRLRKELEERAAAYNQQIAQLNNFNIRGVQIIGEFVDKGLARLRDLLSGITGGSNGGGGSGGTGNGDGSYMPVNPYIGQVWTDSTGKSWVWTGRVWQPATVEKQTSTLNAATRSFSSATPAPERVFSSATQGASATIQINLDGETIRVTSRQQAVDVVGRLLDRQGIA